MTQLSKHFYWLWLVVIFVGVGALVGVGSLAWKRLNRATGGDITAATGQEAPPEDQSAPDDPDMTEPDARIAVKVIHPKKGSMERLSVQPGSIMSFASVHLFAKVDGPLKVQNVDAGDVIKKGDVLAVVDVPELDAQLKRNKAAVKQAQSRVKQMTARITSAEADLEAAKASVTRAEATFKSAKAWVHFRDLQYKRIFDLWTKGSIEQRLVDEAKEHLEAAIETENSSREDIAVNKAKVSACAAKIEQAKADLEEAKAEVNVAKAELERVRVRIEFATIVAPFDGVVTKRNFNPGDYIRAANESGSMALFTVERTDLFRVVVQIPDRDVPYTDKGDTAYVEIDALPGPKIPAKVSRIYTKEDPQTRLMPIEVDLKQTSKGNIRSGMYGKVTIVLDEERNLISIPSKCVTSKAADGIGYVWVVRDGVAHQVPIVLGNDNGNRIAVLDGLHLEDEVVVSPPSNLTETDVNATPVADKTR